MSAYDPKRTSVLSSKTLKQASRYPRNLVSLAKRSIELTAMHLLVPRRTLDISRHLSFFSRNKLSQVLLGLVLILPCAGIVRFAAAQTSQSPSIGSHISTELDNRRFPGTLRAQGDAKPEEDVFTFKDGKFVSEGCLEWGFTPAPYWVRKDSKGVHFLSELSSPEHGTMRYEGTFDGKALKGTAKWKKVRWYWTLERDYNFMGEPSGPAQ